MRSRIAEPFGGQGVSVQKENVFNFLFSTNYLIILNVLQQFRYTSLKNNWNAFIRQGIL